MVSGGPGKPPMRKLLGTYFTWSSGADELGDAAEGIAAGGTGGDKGGGAVVEVVAEGFAVVEGIPARLGTNDGRMRGLMTSGLDKPTKATEYLIQSFRILDRSFGSRNEYFQTRNVRFRKMATRPV